MRTGSIGGLPSAFVSAISVRLFPHAVWNAMSLFLRSDRLTPPMAVTKGELAGQSTSATPRLMASSPESPEENWTEIPRAAIDLKMSSAAWRNSGKVANSIEPQLFEIALTPGTADAVMMPPNRLSKELSSATTRTIRARGAMAWTHSTWTAALSSAQPAASSVPNVLPVGVPITVRLAGGRPMAAENVARSCWMVVDPNASTIATVCPRPSRPVP